MESVILRNDSRTLWGISLFWLLQCSGWLAYGVAMFVWGLDYYEPLDAFVNKALLVLTGFVITLVFRSLYQRARAKSRRPLASIPLLFAVSFFGAAAWRETQNLLFQLYRRGDVALVRIPWGTLLYDGLVLLAWSLLYYGINDWLEIEQQRERAARAEAMLQQARLQALQSQLEPHFLFNTLNAISTLVTEGQNSAAVRMIARVSDFLRLSLDSSKTPEIPVSEELEFVRRYLEIEQVRFGDRLRVSIDAEPDTLPALVPALILQPLVENAVKHGILSRERGGSVTLTVSRKDGALHMAIVDAGPGLANGSDPIRGVGLSNIAARLRELYGSNSRFSIGPSPGGGVAATIELPFRTASASLRQRGTAK